MMYYKYFITYITIGVIISAGVFFWALVNGQFKDQQRARFLPLEEDGKDTEGGKRYLKRHEVVSLGLLVALGFMLLGTLLFFAF